MLKKINLILLVVIMLFTTTSAFAFWREISGAHAGATDVLIFVPDFGFGIPATPCDLASVLIDDHFFEKYMVKNELEIYDWKRDENDNVINMEEISNLTKVNTIIKRDICYIVIAPSYNFVFHGLPDVANTNDLNWALMPVGLRYVSNWAYRANRVVKTDDGQYFMARYYVNNDPLIDRSGWDKIETVQNSDFNTYPNTSVPNYSSVKMENITRSISFDMFTKYLVGDEVVYLGERYRCIKNNIESYPNTETWAWKKV